MEQKQCEQCHKTKNLSEFHKRKNKTDNRMRICGVCYCENLQITLQRAKEHQIQWERKRQQEQEERARRLTQDPVCHDCGVSYARWGEAFDDFYCQPCHTQHFARSPRRVCCVCGEQKLYLNFPQHHQGYSMRRDGMSIYLYCRGCEPAFLALPEDEQTHHIRTACNLAFPAGQVIYGLVCPEARGVRYVGRTYNPTKRLAAHLRDRSDVPGLWGDGKPYEHTWYTRANWMHDLHSRGLQPTMEILLEVPAAPTVIEWETRYILHYLQQGWELVNHESQAKEIVARARASRLDFLRTPFAELLQRDFFREQGIEAFIHTYYRQ